MKFSSVLFILVLLSLSPFSHSLICLYGGYCKSTADCIVGATCLVYSAYYSQCIPATANCIAQNNACKIGSHEIFCDSYIIFIYLSK